MITLLLPVLNQQIFPYNVQVMIGLNVGVKVIVPWLYCDRINMAHSFIFYWILQEPQQIPLEIKEKLRVFLILF